MYSWAFRKCSRKIEKEIPSNEYFQVHFPTISLRSDYCELATRFTNFMRLDFFVAKSSSFIKNITINKCSSDSNTYCLHFLRYYFLSNNVEERPVFEILHKIRNSSIPWCWCWRENLAESRRKKGRRRTYWLASTPSGKF